MTASLESGDTRPYSANGCCADRRCYDRDKREGRSVRGYETPCTAETCMALPEGKTCGDCVHLSRCVAIFGGNAANTSCDFYPRRFRLPVQS